MKTRPKARLRNRTEQAARVLATSLLGWFFSAGVSAANEGILPVGTAAIATPERSLADLSTDQLESQPVEIPVQIEAVPRQTEEIPEEILRTEIITGARSPLTGESLTAAEYAKLQATLNEPAGTPLLSNDIRYLVFLLQVRRAVRPFLPFGR